jgi:hypothetical protein
VSEALPTRYQLMKSMRWIITAVRFGCPQKGSGAIERLICRSRLPAFDIDDACHLTPTVAVMPAVVKVTVDTNMLEEAPIARLRAAAAAAGLVVDIRTVTVNERERGAFDALSSILEPFVWDESRWGEGAWGDDQTVRELIIFDESALGDSVLASSADISRFEMILRIVSNGSFPPPGSRSEATRSQRRQLRDAMALEAHARESRDLFVTADARGFVKHGRGEALERLCSTRIITPDEIGASWP